MLYEGMTLVKGDRYVHVIEYVGVLPGSRKYPSGTRRGMYIVQLGDKRYYMCTSNVSRLHTKFGYEMLFTPCIIANLDVPLYTHASYSSREQENVIERSKGLWKKFKDLLFRK